MKCQRSNFVKTVETIKTIKELHCNLEKNSNSYILKDDCFIGFRINKIQVNKKVQEIKVMEAVLQTKDHLFQCSQQVYNSPV